MGTVRCLRSRKIFLNVTEITKIILPENYISIYKNVDFSIYNRLLGGDFFHKMVKSKNAESNFPSVKTAVKKYSKSFEFIAPQIEGWREFPTGNDVPRGSRGRATTIRADPHQGYQASRRKAAR